MLVLEPTHVVGPDDDVDVIRDRRRDVGDYVVRIRILSVPESDTYPEGIKYAFHYGEKGAETPVLRYDNHHGVHERHDGETVETIEFPGYRPCSDGSSVNYRTT
jgi:hypothetical protein